MKILICNAGSSSIKFSLFEAERDELIAEIEMEQRDRADAVSKVLAELQSGSPPALAGLDEIVAVGHRVVHGGDKYTEAVRITSEVQQNIQALAELAPLHNSASLQVIQAVQRILPKVPQVAAFDTAFHATLSEAARTYPVPYQWTSDWGLRRFGFHGLNHSYCASRAAEMLSRRNLRLITAHLGNGASISAIRDGICVDTSMGFTPLDGLMMGTRSGSVDPGILIHVLRHKGLSADQLDHALNYESGLLGVSGISSDMRDVLAAAGHGEPRARLAIDIYVHRVQQTIGAIAGTLGGVDALVFTAGVGEHAPIIRERVCANLTHLGLELDRDANSKRKADTDIATRASTGRILVIAAREDLAILRDTKRLVPLWGNKGDLS